MGKQLLVLIGLSLVVVYFAKELVALLHLIGSWQVSLMHLVNILLPWSQHKVNLMVSSTIVLILIPFIIGLIPAFIYWLAERKETVHLKRIIWIIWIISALVFVLS